MIVTVADSDLDTVQYEGTVIAVTGTKDNGERVRFAGDSRMMLWLLDTATTFGEAETVVEPWQVLS